MLTLSWTLADLRWSGEPSSGPLLGLTWQLRVALTAPRPRSSLPNPCRGPAWSDWTLTWGWVRAVSVAFSITGRRRRGRIPTPHSLMPRPTPLVFPSPPFLTPLTWRVSERSRHQQNIQAPYNALTPQSPERPDQTTLRLRTCRHASCFRSIA